MRSSFIAFTLAACALGALAGCAAEDPQPLPITAPSASDETVVVLASDTIFGPSMADADTAARYYCSARGKLPQFIARERPPEMRAPSTPEFSLMSYRCVAR